MKVFLRYWYLFVASLLISLTASLGLLFFRTSQLGPLDPADLEDREPPSIREKWFLETDTLENLRVRLDEERIRLEEEALELERWRTQIQSEAAELEQIKVRIEEMRERLDQDIRSRLILIEESEVRNLRTLANIYAEMRVPNVVALFRETDVSTVVKILSLMPSDTVARILNAMAEEDDPSAIRRTRQIIDEYRKVGR